MNEESKTLLVYIAALETLPGSAEITMNPLHIAQIATLKYDDASTKISSKYTDYTDVFHLTWQ